MKKSFHIVQFGYGVLGKAYVDAFHAKGNKVTVIEANQEMVDNYKTKFDIHHMTEDLSHISNVDFIMLMICTPLKGSKLDMSYIYSSVSNVATILKTNPDALVLIRSTVTPTTTKVYKAALEKLLPGQTVHIGMQPEFLRAASSYADALNPWQVVLGHDQLPQAQLDKYNALYSKYVTPDRMHTLTIEEAELMKIFHNSYNACKISYFNNCMLLCQAMNEKNGTNIDMNNIANAMVKTCEGLLNPRYGSKCGHAYWGTCLPKDSAELQNLERQYMLPTKMFDSVVNVNEAIKAKNSKEVLVGDYHMPFQSLSHNNMLVQVRIGAPQRRSFDEDRSTYDQDISVRA